MTEVCSVADPDPAGSVSFFWIWIRSKNRAESLSYSANCDPWSLKSNKNFCKTILQKLIMADFKWIVSRDLRSPQSAGYGSSCRSDHEMVKQFSPHYDISI